MPASELPSLSVAAFRSLSLPVNVDVIVAMDTSIDIEAQTFQPFSFTTNQHTHPKQNHSQHDERSCISIFPRVLFAPIVLATSANRPPSMHFNAYIAKQNATGPARLDMRDCARSKRGRIDFLHTPD